MPAIRGALGPAAVHSRGMRSVINSLAAGAHLPAVRGDDLAIILAANAAPDGAICAWPGCGSAGMSTGQYFDDAVEVLETGGGVCVPCLVRVTSSPHVVFALVDRRASAPGDYGAEHLWGGSPNYWRISLLGSLAWSATMG
jgi:hypothetical protein